LKQSKGEKEEEAGKRTMQTGHDLERLLLLLVVVQVQLQHDLLQQ
jgi:hypothetical protein